MSARRIGATASDGNESKRKRGDKHRWKVLGVGFAANASFAAAFSGIPTTAVFIRSDYAIETSHLGLVLGAMGLGIALSELPWGLLTDKLGDRKVLLGGLGLTTLVLAMMAMLVAPMQHHSPPPYLALALGLFLVGLVGGSVNGSSGRAVMAWFKDGERGFAMSIRQTALPAGGAIGALILPTVAAAAGFQAVYGGLAALCAITTVFVWLWLHEPPQESVSQSGPPVALSSPTSSPLRRGQVWRIVFGLGALCVPQVAVLTFAAVFLNDFGKLTTMAISTSIVVVQVGAAVARIWSGYFTDRRKNRRPFLKGCALLTACVFAALGLLVAGASISPSLGGLLMAVIVLVLVVGGALSSCWHGIAYTELATVAGMDHVGTALGLGNTFAFGAYFVTPLVIPAALSIGGWPVVWLFAMVAALIAFLLFPSARRNTPAGL